MRETLEETVERESRERERENEEMEMLNIPEIKDRRESRLYRGVPLGEDGKGRKITTEEIFSKGVSQGKETVGKIVDEMDTLYDAVERLKRLYIFTQKRYDEEREKNQGMEEKLGEVERKYALLATRFLEQNGNEAATYRKDRNDSKYVTDPDKFNGTTPRYDVWKGGVGMKVEALLRDGKDEEVIIAWIIGRTEGIVQRSLLLRNDPSSTRRFQSYNEVLEQLELQYGNKHREQEALTEYANLYQGGMRFDEFWVKFSNLAAEMDIPEKQQIRDLRHKISLDLQERIAHEIKHEDLYEFSNLIRSIDSNMQSVRAARSALERRKIGKVGSYAGAGGIVGKSSGGEPSERRGTSPMSVAGPGRASTPVREPSQDRQKESFLKNGQCFGCGKQGHIRVNCPNRLATIAELGLGEANEVERSGKDWPSAKTQ